MWLYGFDTRKDFVPSDSINESDPAMVTYMPGPLPKEASHPR
ncbi:hypothetical protein DESC_300087 [Desulfosarcina cetonica]|nr:hypothetical protein DESC_300087 [Desulfosarcina cetonica]